MLAVSLTTAERFIFPLMFAPLIGETSNNTKLGVPFIGVYPSETISAKTK